MNFDKPPDPGAGEEQPTPSGKSTIPLSDFETPPERIGPYRILEVIGEGGMGTVYLAEQERPVRRKVALKIIKLGMDTKEVIGRFEAERQALAMMEHPNIATVYDAGTTETGRPYFVMEYIQGIPITDYCDQKRLSTRERLDLFIGVCKAIHHAHQKAIIHRDVKPSNVLVTILDRKPVPKVIDFGVAKAINQRLTERTVYTEQGRLIGTPAYMSPEQADLTGLNVDTTTDVYSLGALLYELLTGSPSFDITKLREVGYEAIQKYIKEENPPKPSTRVSKLGEPATGVAEKRGTNMAGLVRQLRGELDWITMRAMEKDRIRRYPSASELAADVERYMQNEPIMARPPSAGYYLRKMVARHKAPFAFAGVLFLVLVVGAAAMTALWQRSEKAYQQAEAANLLSLGRIELEKNSTAAVAYAMKSLRFSDQAETRRFIMQALWRGPTMFKLPFYGVPNALTVEFSPDGRWLAVGHILGGLFLYSEAGGEPRAFIGHEGMVLGVNFLGTDLLVTTAIDQTVRLWSVPNGDLIRTWEFDGEVCAYGAPDGEHIYTCEKMEEGTPPLWKVWSLEAEEPIHSGRVGGPIEELAVWEFDVHPKSGHIALWKDDEILLVPPDDLTTSTPIRVGRHNQVARAAFDREGEHLASMNDEGGIRIWEHRGQEWTLARELQFSAAYGALGFANSGTRFVAGSAQDLIPIWDLAGPVGVEPLKLGGKLFSSYDSDFHPSGKWLVSTSDGGVLAAWPLSRPYSHVLPEEMGGHAFAPDGSWLATNCDDCIRLYPLEGGTGTTPRCVFSSETYARTFSVGPQGKNLALSMMNGEVVIVPVDGGEPRILEGWEGYSHGAVFDQTGSRVAAWGSPYFDGRDATLKVWDLDTGGVQILSADGLSPGVPVRFTPEGDLIAIPDIRSVTSTNNQDKKNLALVVWDLESESHEVLLEGITWHNIGMTPDCQIVLYRGEDNRLFLHDLGTGVRRDLPTLESSVVVAALNETGSIAALGMRDGTVYVIHTDNMEPHLLFGHEKPIQGIAIDPKERWVASWAADSECRLWPIPEGKPIHSLPRDELLARLGKLTNLRAVPDDKLASGYRIEPEEFPGWEPVPSW